MSEEKLYAVKNDEGGYWNFADRDGFFELDFASCSVTDDERYTKNVVRDHGGHVVALVEEPEKVVLSKKQAEIVDDAHEDCCPATYISKHGLDEQLLINAYVNGYTVAKENKYNVKVPHTKDVWFFKTIEAYLLTISDKKLRSEFTESEIEHYGLQDCDKEEVTDDEEV